MTGLTRGVFAVWTGVLAALALAWAWSSLGLEFSSAPYRSMATRIEAREPVLAADIEARLQEPTEVAGALSCRPDIVHADMVLHLTSIDRQALQRDEAGTQGALQRGRTALLSALECQPADGNLWLRLAMTTGALTKSVETLDRPMALSTLFAPGEVFVLMTRMAFWSSWPFVPPGPAASALARDIATVATWLRPDDAARTLAALPANAGPQVRAAVARQTDQRRADLDRVGLIP